MIQDINQEIIEKLSKGMSPAEISIEYEKEGKQVSASYARHVKMLWQADMTNLLEPAKDEPADFIKNSRDYAGRA
jgi:hypothetical protein